MTKTHPHAEHAHHGEQTSRNILVAFILNLCFSFYEFIGGSITGSVAIISDAVHDIGDALSIGIAYLLEKRSHKAPDNNYTYGYLRYSLIGGLITTMILIFGSSFVIYHSADRIIHPVEIQYNGMIILAIIGVIVNFLAAWFTHGGHSLNQKSVNLHMLEDVLGWAVVLVGAIVMRFTNWYLLDPIMSIGVALFILKEALSNCWEIFEVLLEKTPHNISTEDLRQQLLQINGVTDIHHLHVWSIDGEHNYATLHVVYSKDPSTTKTAVKSFLAKHNISHITVEMEKPSESCDCHNCQVD